MNVQIFRISFLALVVFVLLLQSQQSALAVTLYTEPADLSGDINSPDAVCPLCNCDNTVSGSLSGNWQYLVGFSGMWVGDVVDVHLLRLHPGGSRPHGTYHYGPPRD